MTFCHNSASSVTKLLYALTHLSRSTANRPVPRLLRDANFKAMGKHTHLKFW